MEILVDELLDGIFVVLNVMAQSAVVEGAQLGDDAIDHCGREHAMLLKDLSLALQAVG